MIISYFNYVWDIEGVSAGAATKAKELLNTINKLGHTTHLEWRTSQPNGQINMTYNLKERFKPRLQKYLHEPKKLASNFINIIQEYHILKRQKPDIFFSRLELYNFSNVLLSQWLKIPMVVETDCPPTYEHLNFYGNKYKHLGNLPQKIELNTLRNADALIAISSILKDYYIEQGIESDKIHVIPNGVDPIKFRPRDKPVELVRKYNLENKIVIGWIGALVGWSGIENMVTLALKILRMFPNTIFILVGSGANEDLFRKKLYINDYASRVLFPGMIPHEEVPNYLACMDIVIAPYPRLPFWYASSMKIFEYMSIGKPVIASNIGQVGEVINNGKNGLLYNPEETEELMQKTILLIENTKLRNQLGENARQEVLNKYTWEQHGKKIITIFEQILQNRERINSN